MVRAAAGAITRRSGATAGVSTVPSACTDARDDSWLPPDAAAGDRRHAGQHL
jgi:hypothetical protein